MTLILHGTIPILEELKLFAFPMIEFGDPILFSTTSELRQYLKLCKNILKYFSADAQYNTATINTNVIVSYTGKND